MFFDGAVVFITVSLLLNSVASPQETQPFSARVKVTVTADEIIEGTITSYINRELRDIGDVKIVDDNEEWELSILAIEAITEDEIKIGYILSVVILKKFNNQWLKWDVKEESKKEVMNMTSELYWYPDHWIRMGSLDDLRELCNWIVADFDTEYLESQRKLYRVMQENK